MRQASVGKIAWFLVAGVGFFTLFLGEGALAFKFVFLEKVFGAGASEIEELREKNRILEVELGALRAAGVAGAAGRNIIAAKAYSLYPFSDRSTLVIASGRNEGVTKEAAVLLGSATLIGRVKEVFDHTSLVETVMSDKLKIPVRVGMREVDALYVGGLSPSIRLVGDGGVARGEIVVAASRDLPYGLAVGTIAEVRPNIPFMEAAVAVPYDLRRVRDVRIVRD